MSGVASSESPGPGASSSSSSSSSAAASSSSSSSSSSVSSSSTCAGPSENESSCDAGSFGPILDLLNGFRKSQVLFASVHLGIFDILKQEPHINAAGVVSKQSESDGSPSTGGRVHAESVRIDSMERLLNACCSLGLLQRSGAGADGGYSLTDLSAEYLCRTSPHSLVGYIRHSHDVLYKLFGHLHTAVANGGNVWVDAFGWEGRELFNQLYRDEAAKRRFADAMHSFSALSADAIARAFDLSEYGTMVDVGGATGALTVALCRRYPHLRATILDLPPVLPITAEYLSRADKDISDTKQSTHDVKESPVRVSGRIAMYGADMFVDPLPTAQLFILSRILHDWSEDKCIFLLKKIYDSLEPSGSLVVVEMILNDDKLGPLSVLLQSLNMLVQTEGKERTISQYQQLLHTAGFIDVRHSITGYPQDVIIARKGGASKGDGNLSNI